MEEQPIKVIAKNKKAWHDYFIEDTCEAGIALFGTEVKSVRQGNINLKDSFCVVKDREIFIRSMHISPYEKGNIFNREPMRVRRLLLHKREIGRLAAKVTQAGYSLIPLRVYLKGSLVKVEIALAKGKKLHDKREASALADARREIERTMKDRQK